MDQQRTSKMYQVSDPDGMIFDNAQRLAELLSAEFGHKVSAPDAINGALRIEIARLEKLHAAMKKSIMRNQRKAAKKAEVTK